MRVVVFGNRKRDIEGLVKKVGFELVDANPQFVISFGGDGTLMKAEYSFPDIPKIILRDSHICKKCSALSNEEILQRAKKKHYKVEKLLKLEVCAGDKILTGMNDIVVHNKDPRHAIRYHISINNKDTGKEIIGDGIIVATPFGSTGYYRSITDSFFEVGIGLAFNNSTEQSDHVILKEDSAIKMSIVRGPAIVYADNQEESIELNDGSSVLIKKSKTYANVLNIN